MYKITTSNNKSIMVTRDHLNPTIDGDITGEKLSVGDMLLFNTNPSVKTQKYNSMTYHQGYIIGSFLGDGSYASYLKGEDRKLTGIVLSLNSRCFDIIEKNVRIGLDDFGVTANISKTFEDNNVIKLSVYSVELAEIVSQYVDHSNAINKSFNERLYGSSVECRLGIIDGMMETDGHHSTNRIYTASSRLSSQIECLCTTLGICTNITPDDRNEGMTIRGEHYDRNASVQVIRLYKKSDKKSMSDKSDLVYKYHNNSIYFSIKSVEEIDYDGNVYCLNISDDSPYFTLPNGIITHNCRMTLS